MDCNSILRKYSRFLLIFFNFLFVLTGIIIVSFGASVKGYFHEYDRFLDDKYFYASDFLIIIGVIIFIISFFGCCGAWKENACMTLTFSTLLIVIFILEVIVGIGGLVLKHKTEGLIEDGMSSTMKQYGNPNNTEITQIWDKVQGEFQCCGVHNYTDWANVPAVHGQIPMSCCKIPSGLFGNFTCNVNTTSLYKHGCLELFGNFIEGNAVTIESVGLTLAIIQLLGIVLSCYLSRQIKSDYETV